MDKKVYIYFILSGVCLLYFAGGQRQTSRRTTRLPRMTTTSSNCTIGQFTCKNGVCLNQTQVCNHHNDCGDRSEETICGKKSTTCWDWQLSCSPENNSCINGYFQCGNGKCIDFKLACNRQDDCGDRSDEQRAVPGLKCTYGSATDICVLPQRYVNDTQVFCTDEADKCHNDNGEFICFRCFNERHIISNQQVCDGVFDCADLSDECVCENTGARELCDSVCKHGNTCKLGQFACETDGNTTLDINRICNRKRDCPNGIDERFCRNSASSQLVSCPGNVRNETILTAYVCDGRPDCYDLSDECEAGCETEQPFCSLIPRFQSSASLRVRCSTETGVFAVTRDEICDGIWSPCSPRIYEEESNCTSRFYCKSQNYISIEISLVCNGYEDCDDGSDERNCTDRFYCTNGTIPISVQNSFKFDDFWDCSDGSDECPTDFLANNAFSSRNEMISNLFLKIWLWFMAIMAVTGNLFVIVKTVKAFRKLKDSSKVSKANHFLIFNLAVADILMGIYLAILAGYSIWFSGNYCFEDEKWRTGNVCRFIGTLSVVSSEASVFILTVLTAVRLFTISNPIRSRDLSLTFILVAVTLAWGMAVVLAVLPTTTLLSDEVTDGAWLPSKYFNSTLITRQKATKFSNEIAIYSPTAKPLTQDQNQILPWAEISDYLSNHSSGNAIRGLFGFYSLNSVCVSKLFVTRNQPGWQFSISIISINFGLFLFVACAYFAIYKVSTKFSASASSNDRGAQMQRKIIKLVVSNFACWVPICILAFIHFSEVAHLDGVVYVVTAVVLLPINSVLNPLLYSNVFERLWKTSRPLRSYITTCRRCKRSFGNDRSNSMAMSRRTPVVSSTENVASRMTHVTPSGTPNLSKRI